MDKQGNYFVKLLNLEHGVHDYKFVVDGVWQYDLGQQHQDDGSGNWNNYIEIGSHKPESSSAKKEEAKRSQPQQQQRKKGKQQSNEPEQRPAKKEQRQSQKKKEKQQPKTPEPQPELVSPELVEESEPQHEPEQVPTEHVEEAALADETEELPETEGKKVAQAIVEISVVTPDVDTDMQELEKFVRSIQYKGLEWHGSKVSDHVFGLKKLNIVCKVREDVSLDFVIGLLEKNTDLVGSATLEQFTC